MEDKVWRITELDGFYDPLAVYSVLRQSHSVLLHSAGGGKNLSRYSLIACHPEIVFKAKNGRTEITFENETRSLSGNPFDLLKELFYKNKPANHASLPVALPYAGGPIGFLSYDCNRYIENIPDIAKDDLDTPDMYFIFPKTVLIFDNLKKKAFSLSKDEENFNNLKSAHLKLEGFRAGNLGSNMSRAYFKKAGKKIIDYIFSGDVYQVNFSQRFQTSFEGDPLGLYAKLCEINPSPFNSFVDYEDGCLISSSPERLIQLNGRKAQTRPIAGTRRRGLNEDEDYSLSGGLLLDDKEKAEHLMLLDLERNDLGKVCDYGTVGCDQFMIIEKYSHVMHIVSNVKGSLCQKKDCFDLLKALFPGGTITGCPKVRCMEIIEELEPTKRGPYTGSIGYISYNGSMDFNIIIRTFLQKKDRLYFQAGAGFVADSVPEREYLETVSKANALFQCLGAATKEAQWELLSS